MRSTKKILYLSQLFPSPPDSGGKIKTLNTLLTLAKEYQVFAVFISEEKPKPTDIKVLTDAGITVKIFYSAAILASVKDDLVGLAKNFARGVPHYVFQYTYPPAGNFIQKAIQKFQPDIIHADHLNMAQYLPKIKNEVWILEHHNVETYLYWTRFLKTTKLTRKFYLCIEMVLTYFFEKKTLPKFDHVFAISKPEEKRLRRIFQVQRVSTQPLVFPPQPVKKIAVRRPQLLFIGGLGWPPNEDAVEWFLTSIWPRIARIIPNAEFHVVGRPHPPFEKTLRLPKNVFLHGYQADLLPFLSQATVFVLPLRMGGGVRLKAFTALAAGVPIVSTPLGVDGLSVQKNKHYLQARSARSFADNVVRLLRSKKTARELATQGLSYLKKHHNLNQNDLFLAQYRAVASKSQF